MSAPTHKLPHDILYYIFLTNAHYVSAAEWRNPRYESPKRGLVTTRRCSQVCQEWRRIILGSSSLWGRLIDVNLLRQSTTHWRDEVLRRTGRSAPLWITYSAMAAYPRQVPQSVLDFLFRVINEHWVRIEILDIRIQGDTAIAWTTGSNLFTRPAPILRAFSVDVSHLPASGELPALPTLHFFSDDAPLLRKFDARAFPLDLHHSWCRSLRSLSTFVPSDAALFMDALASMPFLEHLSVRTSPTFLDQPFPFESQSFLQRDMHVRLPKLAALAIENHLRTCVPFVERVTPAPGCILDMQAEYASDDLPTLLPALRREVNRYLCSYYKHRSGEDDVHLKLELMLSAVFMELNVQPESHLSGCSIKLSCLDEHLMLSDILDAIVPRTLDFLSCLSTVKLMFLRTYDDLEGVPVDSIKDTMSLCTSVEELQADIKSLTLLLNPLLGFNENDIGHEPLLTLPLRTLSVNDAPISPADMQDVIVPFLRARKQAGRRVATLDVVCPVLPPSFAILVNQTDSPLASRVTWTERAKEWELRLE